MLFSPLFPPLSFRQWVNLWVSPLSARKAGWTIRINPTKEGRKGRFDGYMVTPKSRKVKPSIFERSRQNKLFPSAIHHQTKQSPNQDPLKFCGGPPAIFGKGIVLTRRKANKYKALSNGFRHTRFLRFAKTVSLDFSAPLRYCVLPRRRDEHGESNYRTLLRQRPPG